MECTGHIFERRQALMTNPPMFRCVICGASVDCRTATDAVTPVELYQEIIRLRNIIDAMHEERS